MYAPSLRNGRFTKAPSHAETRSLVSVQVQWRFMSQSKPLLTLNSIPTQHAEAWPLKAFEVRMEGSYSCLLITTLSGPLDTLELSDEIFLHTDHNQIGVLFALRFQSQHNCHRLLFSCVCIDVLLFTAEWSFRKNWKTGIVVANREEWSPQSFRSPFGRNLSSILEECRKIRRGAAMTYYFKEKYAHALTRFAGRTDVLAVEFCIGEDELLLMSQATLDDVAEQDETEKTHFLPAYQKVLQDLDPGYKIKVVGHKLFVSNFSPG